MASGSNELNMLIKARVIEIKVKLDAEGSDLPSQVKGISQMLRKMGSEVKLNVKLHLTETELNDQLRKIRKRITDNKPLTIKIDIDENIDKTLQNITKALDNFNKKYKQQVDKMEQTQKKASQALNVQANGNVPTASEVQNYNNIKQYMKVLDKAESIMRSKLKPEESALFSNTQMKDAQGNLQGFVASLTKANGVVEQVHYKWNAQKETFSPVSRKTLDNSQKSLEDTSRALTNLHTQIKALDKGQGKSSLLSEYDELAKRMKSGTLNKASIDKLENMIKEEKNLQSHVDKTNSEYVQREKLIRRIEKSRDADFDKNFDISRRKQFNGMISDLKNQRREAKLIQNDFEALNNVIDTTNLKERQLSENTKKRLAVMKKLRIEAEKTTSSDRTAKRLIEEIALLARKAKRAEDYLNIEKKIQQLEATGYNNKNLSKSIDMQEKIKAHLRTLVNTGKMTAEQFDRAMQELPRTAQRGNADLERQLDAMTRKVKRNADAMKAEANKMKNIFQADSTQASAFKKLIDGGDIISVQKRMGEVLKGTVETITVAENKTDRYGNAITEMKVKMQSAGKQAQTYTMQMNRATGALNQVGQGLEFNANRNLGVFEQLRIAMARVPIWMTAMTAFYGSIRVVQSAVTEIVELDKALTEIRRVASDNINIDTMFRGSVDLSKELGNNVHEILNSVAELSRTFGEMNERQLLAITKTGTLMANVSDLNAEEAVQSLVGTMNAFNIEAEESIRIVDSLNEVDNNFAISTKQLSEGLAKSASTAKTFGVSMEESIGHITAIGSVTMESGRLIGNSLKTIYSRITTLGGAEDILQSVGVAVKTIGENGEEVRPVNDILDDLGKRWDTISDSQRQNIAVTVAGRYQLSRFLALMNNYDTALDATSTAVYSQGSAMRENAEYMKSFEARINQLKNGWTELSDAIGDAVLKSSMMEVLRMLTSLAQVAVKVTGAIGVLPSILGAIALVLLKMKVFSTWTNAGVKGLTAMSLAFDTASKRSTAMGTAISRTSAVGAMGFGMLGARARATSAGIKASMATALTAVRTFSVGFKSLLVSTGIGAIFVGIGFAVEKLVSVYNKKQEKEKELLTLNKKMIESYRSHRDGMDEMVSKYQELNENTSRSAEEERDYLGLQKQLAEQIPTTVSYIDANGKAHLKTTEQIKNEIEAVKELSRQQAELTNAKFQENMKKKSEAYMDVIKNIDKLNDKQRRLEENDGKNPYFNGNVGVDNMSLTGKPIDNSVNIQQNKVEILMAEAEKTEAIQKTIQAVQAQTTAYFEAGNKMSAIGDEQQMVIEKFIGFNEQMLRNADTPEKFEKAYKDLFEIGVEVGEVFVKAYDIMSKDIGDDPLKLADVKKSLGEVAKSIPETFYKMEDEFGKPIKSVDELNEGLKEIINVGNQVSKGSNDWDGLTQRLEDAGLTADQSKVFLNGLANEHKNAELRAIAQEQGVEGLTESISDLNEKSMEAIDLMKSLFGYSGSELEGMKSKLQLMHLLVDTMGEAGKETEEYASAQFDLADYLGITVDELEKNEKKYYDIIDALGQIDLTSFDPSQSWSEFIDSQEIDDKMKETLKNWNGTKDIITGAKSDIVDSNEEVKQSVKEIEDVFGNEIETPEAVKAMREISDEAEDLTKMSWADHLTKWGDDISDWMRGVPEVIRTEMGEWGNAIEDFFSVDSSPVWMRGFNQWTRNVVDWFTGVPDTIRGLFDGWVTAISDFFSDDSEVNWESNLDKWKQDILDWFVNMNPELHGKLVTWSTTVKTWLDEMPTSLEEGFGAWATSMRTWFDSMPEEIMTGLSEWSGTLYNWFDEQNEENKRAFGEWGTSLKEWFDGIPDTITEKLASWTASFSLWFESQKENFIEKMADWTIAISTWFTDQKENFIEKMADWTIAISTWFTDQKEEFISGFAGWTTSISQGLTDQKEGFISGFAEWSVTISTWFKEKPAEIVKDMALWTADIKKWFSEMPATMVKEMAIWSVTLKNWFSGAGDNVDSDKTGSDIIKNIKKGITDNEDDILEKIAEIILDLPGYVIAAAGILLVALGREIIERIIEGIEEDGVEKSWKSAFSEKMRKALATMNPFLGLFFKVGSDSVDEMSKGADSKKKTWKDRWKDMKKDAKDTLLEMVKEIAIVAGSLPKRISDAISSNKAGIKYGVVAMVNTLATTIESGLNAVINGLNKALTYVGADTFGTVSIPRMSAGGGGGSSAPRGNSMGMGVQAYAKGTKNKTHQGGQALVGEEGYELAHIPNQGMRLLGQHGAEILNLPKGSSVLPHKQTQQVLQSYNFPAMPAYALGVGDYFKERIPSLIAGGSKLVAKGASYTGNLVQSGLDVASVAKSSMDDLFDKFSETPKKIIESLLSHVTGANSMTGFAGDMVTGAIKTVKNKAIDFGSKQIKDLFSAGGNVAPSFGSLRMTSPFGWRTHPIFGDKRFHSGVDYAGALGTAIKSQSGGKVTFSGASGNGFGNLVKVKNGAFEYFYAHLQRAIAKVGSMVKKGDLLGTLGSTGNSTGPHVHYEVRQNGRAIQPKGFAVGGKVSKEQIIRVGEGDKEEMIIPLEQHKGRAVALWKEAGERLGQFQYFAKGGKVGNPSSYTVKGGDTLSQLAVQFRTSVYHLMQINKNIKDANKIQKGQVLNLKDLIKTEDGSYVSPSYYGKSSSSTPKSQPKAFSIPLTAEQQVSKWQSQISLVEQKMRRITEHSDAYRDKMKDIVSFETYSLKYQKQILSTTEKRQALLLKRLANEPKKKSEEKQAQYDGWRDEYDSNIDKIQSLKVEIEGIMNTIQEKTLAIFTNLVDEIMARSERRIALLAKRIDDTDFEIEVAELTDPDNAEKRLELQAKRAKQAKEQQNEVLQLVKQIEANYNRVVKANGANSEQAKRWKEELEKVNSEYQDITLEALRAEKSVEDARQEIADKGIDQLKNYYGQVRDLATQAIDAEKEQLQEAHDEKMKMYDKESEKISKVYDDKLQAMDKEKSEQEYLDELNDKNAKKAELLAKISVLSRDTSVEGRKKVADLQKELEEMNTDIADFQKERQDSLLREALEAQRDAQLDAIEDKRDEAEAELETGLTGLDEQKEAIDKKYSDLINNEKYWADMRDEYTKGSFEKLNAELEAMYKAVDEMNQGLYSSVIGNFGNLSDAVRDKFVSDNKQDMDNTKYQNDNLREEVDSSQQAETDTTTKQGRLVTGAYKDKKNADRTRDAIEKDYAGKDIRVVSTSNGWKVRADFSSVERAKEVLDRLKVRKMLGVGHISSFESGGYTGSWGKEGKLAMLHEKEIVMKKDDTRNILDATKIVRSVSKFLPNVMRSSVSDKLATAEGVSINNHYELNVNVENMNGTKKDIDTLSTTVMKSLKKMGKR